METSQIGRPCGLRSENEDRVQRQINSLTRENILKELPNLTPTTQLNGFLGNVIKQYETDVNACRLKLAEYMEISNDRDLIEYNVIYMNERIKLLREDFERVRGFVHQWRDKYMDLQTKYKEVQRKENIKSVQICKLLRQTENTKLYSVLASVFREPVPAELGFNVIGSQPQETTTIEVDQETIREIGEALRQAPLDEEELQSRSVETKARLQRETALNNENYATMLDEGNVSLLEAQEQNVKDQKKIQHLTKRLKETEDALVSTNKELLDVIENSKRDKILRYFQSYPLENNLRSVMENITTDDKPIEILNRLSEAYENAAMVRDAIEKVSTNEVSGFEQIAKEFLKEAVASHISRGVQTEEVKSSREQVNADRLVKKSVERLNVPCMEEVACEAMPSVELASQSAEALEVRPPLSSKFAQAQEDRPEFRSGSMQAIKAQRELCSKFVQASEVQRKLSSKFVQVSETKPKLPVQPKLSSKFVQAQTESMSQSMQALIQPDLTSQSMRALETEPKLSSKTIEARPVLSTKSMQALDLSEPLTIPAEDDSDIEIVLENIQAPLPKKAKIEEVAQAAQNTKTLAQDRKRRQSNLIAEANETVSEARKLRQQSGGIVVDHIISHKYCHKIIAALEDHIEKLLIELKEGEARFAKRCKVHKVCYDSYVRVKRQLQQEQDHRNDIINPYIRQNAQLVKEVNSLKRIEAYRPLEIEGCLTEITRLKDQLSRFETEVTKNVVLRDSEDSLQNVFLESLRKAIITANTFTKELLKVKAKFIQGEPNTVCDI